MSMDPVVPAPGPLPGGGIHWHPARGTPLFRISQAFCRVGCSTLFDLKVFGSETFPPDGGVLVVSNHQSLLDPVLIGVAMPRPLSYMAKSELFTNPLFAALIRAYGAFPVRQTGSAAGAIKETIDRLREGAALNIFPEGTRTPAGGIRPFEKGTALVVRKAKVPVVPVAVHGSFEAWPSGTKLPTPHPVRIQFGPPMLLHDQRPDVITDTLERSVRGMFDALRARDPHAEEKTAWAAARRDRYVAEKKAAREKRSR
ncbi:MAG: plsC 2 [Phycisphaerales bacterium]|nr:plsC 2 [Phycisphaerales bacterium]